MPGVVGMVAPPNLSTCYLCQAVPVKNQIIGGPFRQPDYRPGTSLEQVHAMIATATIPDDLLSVAELAARLRVCSKTITRWCEVGCRGHRLRRFRIGWLWKISMADAEQFVTALTAASEPAPAGQSIVKQDKRSRRAARAASEQLAREGW